ncbi:MAG: hypothetical protein HUU26_00985 [Gemmatimonadaceae bacterium]|nr:hypothetical protein [Gemmatimonadaceae bacterium]
MSPSPDDASPDPRWEKDSPAGQSTLARAFPSALRSEALAALEVVPFGEWRLTESFILWSQGERLEIPARIYAPEPDEAAENALAEDQRTILHCLYSRHHDGHVRQRRIEQVIRSSHPWVVPFVVGLAGDYVVEIQVAILKGLADLPRGGSPQRRLYGDFVRENPAFLDLTSRRVTSYWDCYHRWRYPKQEDFPGSVLVAGLLAAGLDPA